MEGYTEVFSWGDNTSGQLGLGSSSSNKSYTLPLFCSFNILIKDISCGEDHTGFVSDSGHVYTMGSNLNGKLGINNRSLLSSNSPCLVEDLAQYSCSKISCGWTHTAVVTNEGTLFTWGSGENGATGSGDFENLWRPQKIACNISEVSCGARHLGAISNGQVLMCGAGESGQLGTGRRQNQSKLVKIQSENAIQISCGVFHSGFLTDSGEVFMMGGNNFGQLGTGTTKSVASPCKINIKEGIKLVCGNSSACITSNGVFVWGSTIFGESLVPKKIKVSNKPVIDFCIGGGFCIAVDSKYSVFTWGSNSHGELALGDFENKNNPAEVSALKGKCVKKIAAGSNFVICLGVSNREKKEISSNTARFFREGINKDYSVTSRENKTEYGKGFNKSMSPQNRVSREQRFDQIDENLYGRPLKKEENSFHKKESIVSELNFIHKSTSEYEDEITKLTLQNQRLKEELFKANKQSDYHRPKEDSEQTVSKLKESYLNEIHYLKMQLEGQLLMQKEVEKDLETAVSHTNRLEEALTQAQKELTEKNSQSDLLSKIQKLEEEKTAYKELLDNSDAQCKEIETLLEKCSEESSFYMNQTQDLLQERQKLNSFIQDLQSSIENLSSIIKEHETLISKLSNENNDLQSQVLNLQSLNKQIVQNFEKDVSQKAKIFKDKTLNILSGQKSNPQSLTPDRSFEDTDNLKSSRKELSDRQQIKIQKAVNKLLENKEVVSPLKSLRISSPTRASPERPSPYKSIQQEFNGITPSKEDVKSKINSLMQNRSRIEQKLRKLQNEEIIL